MPAPPSSFTDEAYVESGASVGDAVTADVVFGVNPPSSEQLGRMKEGATLVSLLSPALDPDLVEDLSRRPITAMAMDAVPRISRAQSLDVLSSMANIAGYRAVVSTPWAARSRSAVRPGRAPRSARPFPVVPS